MTLELPGPGVRLARTVDLLPTDRVQEDLFAAPSRRNPVDALAAIEELCAELGNDAVQIARLTDAHLPEEQFAWTRVAHLPPPRVSDEPRRPRLVRRMLHEPLPFAGPSGGDSVADRTALGGPYELSGGWWQGAYRREYYYLHDRSGRLLWVYRDAPDDAWFVQGVVE